MGKRKTEDNDAGPNAKKMSINPSMPVIRDCQVERFVADPTSKIFYACREFVDGTGKRNPAQISSSWAEMQPYVQGRGVKVEFKGFGKKKCEIIKSALLDAEDFAGIKATFKAKQLSKSSSQTKTVTADNCKFLVDPNSPVFYACKHFIDRGHFYQAQITSDLNEMRSYIKGKGFFAPDVEFKSFKKKNNESLQDAENFAGIRANYRFVVDSSSAVFYACKSFVGGDGTQYPAQISSSWKEMESYVKGTKAQFKGFKKKNNESLHDAEDFAGIKANVKRVSKKTVSRIRTNIKQLGDMTNLLNISIARDVAEKRPQQIITNKRPEVEFKPEIGDVPPGKAADDSLLFVYKEHFEKRVYAEFYCNGCYRSWSSGYGWISYGVFTKQKCKGCETPCLPWSARHLERNRNTEISDGHHDQERCGKCRELGHSCR